MSRPLLLLLLLLNGTAFSQPTELPDTLICFSRTQSNFVLSVMDDYHRAMNKLQLLNERVSIYEVRERQLKSAVLAKDSSLTDLKHSLSLEIRAGEMCESDLDGVKRKLRQEKTQKRILAGTTVALIGAVVWMAVSN